MGTPVDFPGTNLKLTPPVGWSESQVRTMSAFKNSSSIVSCWELDIEELVAVVRTGRVWVEILGHRFAPMFVGSEATVREVTADYGAVWPAGAQDGAVAEAVRELRDIRDRSPGATGVVVPTDLIDRLIGAPR